MAEELRNYFLMVEDREYFPDNLIVDLSFRFGLRVIDFCELLETKRRSVIANQLLRCGTSIRANLWEAQGAVSKADFIHKMKIACREAEETAYFLLLCHHSPNYPECSQLLERITSIKKVLNKIIASSKAYLSFVQ